MELKNVYLFENLAASQIKRLEQISLQRSLKKGNVLFFEGDEPKNLHILTEGVLKVYKSDFKGNEVVLKYFSPVSLIAELANLDHIPYPATAVFETDGKVIAVDFKIFEKEFLRNPDVSLAIIRSLTWKLRDLEGVISRNLTMDATSRVAKFLYENEGAFLQLKQNKISSILNITPETMSRVLKKLKEGKIIGAQNTGFKILDKEKLKEFFVT
jgi:CRP/FNR family transcriptional regulator